MKNSKIGTTALLYILVILICSIWIFISDKIFPCEPPKYVFLTWSVAIIILTYALYEFFKTINYWLGKRILFIVIPFVFALQSGRESNKSIVKEITLYGGKVKKAVIYKKYWGRSIPNIYYKYEIDGRKKDVSEMIESPKYKKIEVGDTILVIQSFYCSNKRMVYRYFPTSSELVICTDSAFLIDNVLISAEEFLKK